ncbi:MAG: BlaI/MecI/CopY family transcriptional regulator [Faecalibacterium sp.]|nr:BlaI/MecI/CopY family transcriptional regulator [Faecalibacterium sp.]
MLAVWAAAPPATRAEIARHLPRQSSGAPWAPSTILNFLYRLEKKGWVKSERVQNRNVYIPAVTRRAYGVAVMRERMDTLFAGSVPEAVAALVSEAGASQSQLEKARTILSDKIAAGEEYDLYDPYG